MIVLEHFNPNWPTLLKNDHLTLYESLWKLNQNQWFEAPNIRRGGWSGVCKASLFSTEVGLQNVFLKRQENHSYISLMHGLTHRPTFEREFKNIRHFKALGIPTLEIAYFAIKKVNGKYQCILVIKDLEGYQSLDSINLPALAKQERRDVLESIAETMRKMHKHGYQHGSLYPKHIFVKSLPHKRAETCFIDLEKTRKRLFKKQASINDLSTLHRHLNDVKLTDRLRFFLAYRQEKKLSVTSKKWLKTILLKKSK